MLETRHPLDAMNGVDDVDERKSTAAQTGRQCYTGWSSAYSVAAVLQQVIVIIS
jgi:hypothetical protein